MFVVRNVLILFPNIFIIPIPRASMILSVTFYRWTGIWLKFETTSIIQIKITLTSIISRPNKKYVIRADLMFAYDTFNSLILCYQTNRRLHSKGKHLDGTMITDSGYSLHHIFRVLFESPLIHSKNISEYVSNIYHQVFILRFQRTREIFLWNRLFFQFIFNNLTFSVIQFKKCHLTWKKKESSYYNLLYYFYFMLFIHKPRWATFYGRQWCPDEIPSNAIACALYR